MRVVVGVQNFEPLQTQSQNVWAQNVVVGNENFRSPQWNK